MVDSLCNCGKTGNPLLLEDKSVEIEYRPSEENDELLDNNDISMPHINFLYKKVKRNHLINEISRNRQLELNGLVGQQYTEIKQKSWGKNKRYRKRNKLLERGTFEYKSTAFKFKQQKFNVLHTRRCVSIETNIGI